MMRMMKIGFLELQAGHPILEDLSAEGCVLIPNLCLVLRSDAIVSGRKSSVRGSIKKRWFRVVGWRVLGWKQEVGFGWWCWLVSKE